MNWKKFFSWFKDKKNKTVVDHLDKQLVKNINARRWPSLSQLHYLPRFLNRQEKILAMLLLSAAGLTAMIWAATFVAVHHGLAPREGGEYSEAIIGQPKLINPIFASINDVDADLSALIYSGLFRYDHNQQLVGDLATAYELSSDKKTYTINLRKNVKWSDGEPFTAEDVVYTFETIQNPEVGSPVAPGFQGITVEKTGDYSVTFMLKESFAPFLNSLTIGILPEHIWNNYAPNSIRLAKNNIQPIGTGPWVFDKLIKDDNGKIQNYSLARNENYYLQKPYLKNITFKFFEDYQQTIDALRQKDVLGLSFVPRNLKEKITSHNITFYQAQLPQYTALFFNQNGEPTLKDANLRLALAKALDKNLILKEGLDGAGEVVDAPILKTHLGYNPDIEKISFDAGGASALLDKNWSHIQPEEYFQLRQEEIIKNLKTDIEELKNNASTTPEVVSSTIAQWEKQAEETARGEMHLEQPFYRKNKNGKILSLAITTADTAEYRQTAETMAKMWRTVGIQTSIILVPSRQIVREALKNRNYQILLYGEIVGNDPDPYPFWHSSQVDYPGLNLAIFANRAADKILEDARASNDQTARADLYKKFQDILVKELPAIFLYSPSYTFAVDKQIKGVDIGAIASPSDRYNNLNNWYFKTKWIWK